MVEDRLRTAEQLDPVLDAREELGGERADPVVLLLRIDRDPVALRGEQVPHRAQGKGELPVDQDGGRGAFALLPDRLPEPDEVIHVGLELPLRPPLGRRAHDRAHPLGADRLHDLRKPVPLLRVLDPAGDPDVTGPRQEDQVASGEGDVAGDPRPLRPERLLGHLDEQVLPLPDEPLDRRDERVLREAGGPDADLLGQDRLLGRVGVELELRRDEVAREEESRLVHPDVDEGGLHPREDADDLSVVDVADGVPVLAPLDQQLDEDPGFERRHPRLVRRGVHHDQLAGLLHRATRGGGSAPPTPFSE